uniref:Uncharacterized protein n=2 Tax=Cacopsylla melanoneura TaxID=428564 RepID=A0A8D8RXB7_9HEMI
MSATVKHTLFYFTLVILLQQYLSIQPAQNRHRKQKRAILQDTESNHTIPSEVQTTMSMNLTTLTSEERIEQMKKLKEAELHLRKNLKEKGKEYENQLYENWPKLIKEMENPKFFENDAAGGDLGFYSLAKHLKMKPEDLKKVWPYLINVVKTEGVEILETMVDVLKSGLPLPAEVYSGVKDRDYLMSMLNASESSLTSTPIPSTLKRILF